jgi:hypothetical protein
LRYSFNVMMDNVPRGWYRLGLVGRR